MTREQIKQRRRHRRTIIAICIISAIIAITLSWSIVAKAMAIDMPHYEDKLPNAYSEGWENVL